VGYRDNAGHVLFYRFDRDERGRTLFDHESHESQHRTACWTGGTNDTNFTVFWKTIRDIRTFVPFVIRETNLRFRFGDVLRYEGRLLSDLPPFRPGEPFCPQVALTALRELDGSHSFGLHLVNAANTLIAQHDAGIGVRVAGEQVRLDPCLDLPADLPPGDYYLHLIVYTWADGKRLPLLEGGNADVSWGDALVLGAVTVGH
jgi:hypothetical protein